MTANEIMKSIKDNLDSVDQNLEQIQCDDCILRQAAIRNLNNEYHGMISDESMKIYEIIEWLDSLPSVTPKPKIVPIAEIKFDDDMLHEIVEEAVKNIEIEPKWITVGERLPQKDESVLLTICANSSLYGFNENFVKVMCGSYSPCEDKRDWVVNEIRYYIDNVIAWMPLPQPYKAESEE